jgi:hypothetical protein
MTCWTLGDMLIFMTSSLLMPLHRRCVHKHKRERPWLFFSMWARQTHGPRLLDYLHRRVLRDQLGHLLVRSKCHEQGVYRLRVSVSHQRACS